MWLSPVSCRKAALAFFVIAIILAGIGEYEGSPAALGVAWLFMVGSIILGVMCLLDIDDGDGHG